MRCSSPGAPILSDEAAQALEDRQTAGSHAGLASQDRVGREAQTVPFISGSRWEKSQPSGGFPKEGFTDPRWQRTREGPAGWQGGSRQDKDRTCLGGRLCSNKGIEAWGQKHNQISPQRSSLSSGCSFSRSCPQGLFCHQSASKSLGSVVISTAVFLDNSQKTLFWDKKKHCPEQHSCLLALVRGTFSLLT